MGGSQGRVKKKGSKGGTGGTGIIPWGYLLKKTNGVKNNLFRGKGGGGGGVSIMGTKLVVFPSKSPKDKKFTREKIPPMRKRFKKKECGAVRERKL